MPETKRAVEPADAQDFAFLGREFLTWLIWRVDRGEGEFAAPEGAFSVAFGGRVRLKAMAGDATDVAMRGPSPAHGIGARAGVGAGQTVREAEMRIARGEREWRFTLLADTFDLRGVKLPALLTEEEDDRFLERMALLDELDAMIRTAFAEFLRERTRPAWPRSTLPALRDWVADGLRVDL